MSQNNTCPKCGSRDLDDSRQIEVDGVAALQYVVCNACLESWVDVYKFSHRIGAEA